MSINKFLILFILALGAFLRLYKLDSIPNGFYVDEAAIGYNAYSILETGKDEYGKQTPIFLRSYEAYSSPLYTYLTTLPISLLGLSVFSVRLVSAISGTINILLIYLILSEFNKKNTLIPILGALIFAISPWSIFFSRGAFEANLALLLFSFFFYFLIKSSKSRYAFVISMLFLTLTTYAYQAYRLSSYLILGGIFLIHYSNKKSPVFKKNSCLQGIIVFAVFQIPMLLLVTTPAFSTRAAGLFYGDLVVEQSRKIAFLPDFVTLILSFLREYLSQFFSYLSPHNLFYLPDPDLQRSIPELSVFYSWMVIPFVIGSFVAIKSIKRKDFKYLFLVMICSAAIPALTKDPFSSLRSLSLLLPFVVLISFGSAKLLQILGKTFWAFSMTIFLFISLFQLWRSYFIIFPVERANAWDYGYYELSQIVVENPEKTFVIDQSRQNPSYILMAFYLKVPPHEFHQIVDQTIKDKYYEYTEFNREYFFENIETKSIVWENDVYRDVIIVGDTLTVSDSQAQEHYLTKVFDIKNPSGESVFVGYQTNPLEKCKNTSEEVAICKSS